MPRKTTSPNCPSATKVAADEANELILSLRLLDPLLQFLTRSSGNTSVPFQTLRALLPGGYQSTKYQCLLRHIPRLAHRGVLELTRCCSSGDGDASNSIRRCQQDVSEISWDDCTLRVGFPSPASVEDTSDNLLVAKKIGSLCGSTKAAAKRRLTALRRSLKENPGDEFNSKSLPKSPEKERSSVEETTPTKEWKRPTDKDEEVDVDEEVLKDEKQARESFMKLFGFKDHSLSKPKQAQESGSIPDEVLPEQLSYGGTHSEQSAKFQYLSDDIQELIPDVIMDAFGLAKQSNKHKKIDSKMLYSHQATAIESAIRGLHTLVCTSTGSGKSLCFLLPALSAAYRASMLGEDDGTASTSIIMFPTKALAQDQLSKLTLMISKNKDLEHHIIPCTLDGDCTHEKRAWIAKNCNIILTNPDTLHAAILPNWNSTYKALLSRLKYVVIDEAHVYEGIFGAHVALVMSRLLRVCSLASSNLPIFVASSATLPYPEHHMRLLCPIPKHVAVTIISPDDDGSPRSAKHFFVWNPPILNIDGFSTGRVTYPVKEDSKKQGKPQNLVRNENDYDHLFVERSLPGDEGEINLSDSCRNIKSFLKVESVDHKNSAEFHRRHAANEMALLFARAVSQNVRCIAFCKTRMVVEWVYERAIAALKSDPSTSHLTAKVESYRGGYTLHDRRKIEERLFNNKIIGVVGTCALELGVDIGGIDLTLHCGFPTSVSSLLQQAGRAGRGGARLDVPSIAAVVCFDSPSEQHLWRHPERLLNRAYCSPNSIPIYPGIAKSHLLCASAEHPITGKYPTSVLQKTGEDVAMNKSLSDHELFGSEVVYNEALQTLVANGSVVEMRVPVFTDKRSSNVTAFRAHAVVGKAWAKVSLRSIENINYSIVNVSHPMQGGKMDMIHDERAIMDNISYSRVFYHAFPGAIIIHRGIRYKVLSITRPPPFDKAINYKFNVNLAAYAKPTRERYMTRPLSTTIITVVKQIERVDIPSEGDDLCEAVRTALGSKQPDDENIAQSESIIDGSLAGCGIVTYKKTVHGYKKISLVNRSEISRAELSLPPIEYDTFGFWIDGEAGLLRAFLGEAYGYGMHALSHALLAVSPIFIPCARCDLECDHSVYAPRHIMLFDERAGGSGTCAELWKFLFVPNGLLHAAIELLEECPSCRQDGDDYDGGCPACLHSGECVKFNMFLSKSAALVIAKRMLKRIQKSELYKKNKELASAAKQTSICDYFKNEQDSEACSTPRKKARTRALEKAKDLNSTRERLFVVGRPSWPTDEDQVAAGRQVQPME